MVWCLLSQVAAAATACVTFVHAGSSAVPSWIARAMRDCRARSVAMFASFCVDAHPSTSLPPSVRLLLTAVTRVLKPAMFPPVSINVVRNPITPPVIWRMAWEKV